MTPCQCRKSHCGDKMILRPSYLHSEISCTVILNQGPVHTQLLPVFPAHIDGLVQDCSNSIANAMELLQSCTRASTLWNLLITHHSDGLVEERCNSSALAMELPLSCTNPSILTLGPFRPKGYCHCLHLSIRPSVRKLCLCYDSSQIWAGITKFAPNMHHGILLVGIENRDHWPWPSRSLDHFNAETAFNITFVHWSRPAKGCYVSQTCSCTYLALMEELWSVFCENHGEKWLHCKQRLTVS